MKLGLIEIKKAYYGIVPLTSSNAFIGTTPVVAQAVDDRLRFVANAASSFYLDFKCSAQAAQYSTDGTNWTDIPTSSASAVQMASGDTVYLRGKLNGYPAEIDYTNFSITGDLEAVGNIMYWCDYEHPEATSIPNVAYCFYKLFYNCLGLTYAGNLILPATTLKNYCYQYMFANCRYLTSIPELPATTLATGCYKNMFEGCSIITSAPALPATTLTNECYYSMFDNCLNLTSAPALPATTLKEKCYVTMFNNCRALTSAPELPATTLVSKCYLWMFYNCTNLSYIKCLATNISASSCVENWTNNVSRSGTFIKAASMSSWSTGANGIPSGWTVQDA